MKIYRFNSGGKEHKIFARHEAHAIQVICRANPELLNKTKTEIKLKEHGN